MYAKTTLNELTSIALEDVVNYFVFSSVQKRVMNPV
jgi:hypothetical protein